MLTLQTGGAILNSGVHTLKFVINMQNSNRMRAEATKQNWVQSLFMNTPQYIQNNNRSMYDNTPMNTFRRWMFQSIPKTTSGFRDHVTRQVSVLTTRVDQ